MVYNKIYNPPVTLHFQCSEHTLECFNVSHSRLKFVVVCFQSMRASAGPVIYHICSGAVSGLMFIHIYHLIYIELEIYLYIYVHAFSTFKGMQQMYANVSMAN